MLISLDKVGLDQTAFGEYQPMKWPFNNESPNQCLVAALPTISDHFGSTNEAGLYGSINLLAIAVAHLWCGAFHGYAIRYQLNNRVILDFGALIYTGMRLKMFFTVLKITTKDSGLVCLCA